MNEINLLEMLAQADSETMDDVFDTFTRGAMRYAFPQAMQQEVEQLCGTRHARGSQADCFRSGSAPGVAFFDTDSESVRRPRVRRRLKDGGNEEVSLRTYQAGKQGNALHDAIIRCFEAGVSGRKMDDVLASNRRTSKSEVSRLWEAKGNEYVETLRGRPLSDDTYVVLMIDGVRLSDKLTVVVALGVTDKGEKRMLDFEIGSSESNETCTGLTNRLVRRGFRLACRRPLAVLDGSQALRHAVHEHWPQAAIQTCLVHVARTLRGKLSRKWHGELERLFKRIRQACDLDAALEAYADLEHFVASHSAEGLKSLKVAEKEMLTLFHLSVPDTFNKPLLSSNSVENSIRNMRRQIGRVSRWRTNTDMAPRWIACAMLEAEKGFRRIQGYGQMHKLVEALNRVPAPEIEYYRLKELEKEQDTKAA